MPTAKVAVLRMRKLRSPGVPGKAGRDYHVLQVMNKNPLGETQLGKMLWT